jgi:O-antigen/teichoic acid export membrane protein
MADQRLATRAGRALGVNLANTLFTRLGTLAIGIALARIVGPEEFGTFAVGLLALTAMLSFSELGVSLAIVRWPDSPREIAPTVATISTISAGILALVTVATAPWFCEAMGAPGATNVVRLLAVAVFVSGIVATPAALLQREFRAGRRMLIDQVGAWTGAVVSIATAIGGMGAMSLAVGRLAGVGISAVMFLCSAPMSFGFDRAIAKRLLSFGLPLAGSSIVVFAVTYVDQFVVASLLGPVALGFYVLAFNLSSWPITVFSQPVRQVSPATFARLQRDAGALRRSFVLSASLLAAITLPVCMVLTGAAVPLIDLVYGSEWAPAAAALAWLGVLAGMRILFELVYDYFVVLGSTRVVFTVQVIWLIALAPAVYLGAELAGIAGASAAHVGVAVAVILPIYLIELRRVGIAVGDLARAVAGPAAFGAAVGLGAYVAHRLTDVDLAALAGAGLVAVAALAVQAPGIRAELARLRSTVTEGSARREPGGSATTPAPVVYPTPAHSS